MANAGVEHARANEEARTIEGLAFIEEPVDRVFGREVLVHEPAAVDLKRVPLLSSKSDASGAPSRRCKRRSDRGAAFRGRFASEARLALLNSGAT